MKIRATAAIFAFSALTALTASAATTWNVDPVHSSAQFTATHLMISHVSGIIPIKTAAIQTAEGSDLPVSVRAELDPQGIDTRVGMRDDDLRSEHFLDVSAHPNMSFESTKIIVKDDKHFVIDGVLTMHGQTKPVTLNAQLIGKGPGVRPGEQRIAFTADGTIDRTQWGMTYGNPVVGNSIDVHLEIEAVKQ